MENRLQNIDWIEKYLNRGLTPDETAWLEMRLESDAELRALYQERLKLIEGIRLAHLQNKLTYLKNLDEALQRDQKRHRLFSVHWKTAAVAAGMIGLITASILIFRQPDAVELYTTYFEPYPNLFEPIVRGQQGEDPRALAFAAYSAGDYAEARIQFHKLLVIKKEADVLLLLGNANLILGHDGEAENNFLTILKEFSELHSQAKWYLAMCYLKRGELEKAKIVLKELERPDASYSEKSADLLNQIQ